jgi:hypothetical protein
MMYHENFVKDFSLRTFENMKIVCDRKDDKDNPAYRVTQLVNSLIGLLIFPQQGLYNEWKQQNIMFPSERMRDIAKKGKCEDCYFQMLRRLRNAVSHEDMKPHPKESTAIEMQKVKGFNFIDDEARINMYLEIKDIYNVMMSIFYLILGEKEFPWNDAREYAGHFHAELDIEGIRR